MGALKRMFEDIRVLRDDNITKKDGGGNRKHAKGC
jgi:hypothetical protein